MVAGFPLSPSLWPSEKGQVKIPDRKAEKEMEMQSSPDQENKQVKALPLTEGRWEGKEKVESGGQLFLCLWLYHRSQV